MAKPAQRLSELRSSVGSVRDVAHRAGLSFSTLYRIEAGTLSPSLRTLCQIAKALDRPLEVVVAACVADRPDLGELLAKRTPARVLPYRRRSSK